MTLTTPTTPTTPVHRAPNPADHAPRSSASRPSATEPGPRRATRWRAATVAGAALLLTSAGNATAEVRQDVVLEMDELSLIRASFTTTYSDVDASLMRRGAEALGERDGTVSADEARNFTNRAAGELDGQETSRAFLDGFRGVQLRPVVTSSGLEGDVNATGPVELTTELLLVMPATDRDRHLLVMVPTQGGSLSVSPPEGWHVARVKGAEPSEKDGTVSASLDAGAVVVAELARTGAGDGASAQGDGGSAGLAGAAPGDRGAPGPGTGLLIGALLAAASVAATARARRGRG